MPVSWNDAQGQYRKAVEDAGGTWNAENENDARNRYNQASDAEGNTGQGASWNDSLGEARGVLAQRYQRPTASNGGTGGSADPNGRGAALQQVSQAYGSGGGTDALSAFLAQQTARDQQGQQNQAQLRQILMGQIGQLQQPVSAESPGIREVLAGQRIGLQRGTERGIGQAAEQRAYEGYGANSDQLRMDRERLTQGAAESDAQMTGQVLGQEMQQRRQMLTQLLNSAMASGDAESARAIQSQLAAIQSQLGQSNFYDTMGFNYANMNQNSNQATLQAILEAMGRS